MCIKYMLCVNIINNVAEQDNTWLTYVVHCLLKGHHEI